MEKLNLNLSDNENPSSKDKDQELSAILKCLKEECGIDGSLLTEEDLRMYRNLKDGKLSVDNFRSYRDKLINDENSLPEDRREFLAHIASRVMVDHLKKDIPRNKQI